MSPRSVALVESVFQLWMLHEAVDAGLVEVPDMTVLRGSATSPATSLPVVDERLAATFHVASGPSDALRRVLPAHEVIVGDAFSKLAGAGLRARTGYVTFLDDGASSLELARCFQTLRVPLSRAHEGVWAKWFGSVTRMRVGRLVQAGRTRWVTGFDASLVPSSLENGPEVVRHRWGWARRVSVGHEHANGIKAIVLGSAMCADGLLDPLWYRTWLSESLARGGLFVPHRRERPSEVALAGSIAAVRQTDWPVEFVVAGARAVSVRCLPSTPALTVPLLAPAAALESTAIPASAWRSSAPVALRQLVETIAGAASRP